MGRMVSVSDRLSSKAFIIGLISFVAPIVFAASIGSTSVGPKGFTAAPSAGGGNPAMDLLTGRRLPKGEVGVRTLKQGSDQDLILPLALTSGDFDEDGAPDLVTGYAGSGGGIITVHRGNLSSIDSKLPELPMNKRVNGSISPLTHLPIDPLSFLPGPGIFELPEAPEFLGSGDFDGDGHLDLVTTARGSRNLYLLPGDGTGSFGPVQMIDLPGQVTAFLTGESNRTNGSVNVIAGIVGATGPELLIFNGAAGALKSKPEVVPLPAQATSMAIGRLDDDGLADLAVVAGGGLLIVHGRDRKLTLSGMAEADISSPAVEHVALPFAITSVTVGGFVSAGQHGADLAVLSEDGAVRLLARKETENPRAGGPEELRPARESRWVIEPQAEGSIIAGSPMPQASGSSAHLVRAKLLGRPTDDLVVWDQINGHILVLSTDAEKDRADGTLNLAARRAGRESPRLAVPAVPRPRVSASFDVNGNPTAIQPIRLNGNGLPGLVVLRGDPISTADAVLAPETAFTATTRNAKGEAVPAFSVIFAPPGAIASIAKTIRPSTETLASTFAPLQAPAVCTLTPPAATNAVGTMHTVTCTVTSGVGGPPIGGVLVGFFLDPGSPNLGAVFTCSPVTCMTNAMGQVTATYTGLVLGTDTIRACVGGLCTPGAATCTAMKTWVIPAADLSVTKIDAPDPVVAGTNLTYTIVVTNNGPATATGVMLTDPLPAGTTFVSMPCPAGWTCTTPPVGGTLPPITATKPTMINGETATFILTVNVNASTPNGTIITNIATVTGGPPPDPNPLNNVATATTTVAAQADLAVTKADAPDPVIAGNNLTYTLTFTNNGPSDSQLVTLTDVIPAGTTFVSTMQNSGPAFTQVSPPPPTVVQYTIATFAAGATATFTIVVNVNASTPNGTIITNTALETSGTFDPNPANNTATATTTVAAQADLAVTKTDAPDPVIAGNNITYTIGLTNNGPSDAQTVALTDLTPVNTTFVSFMQNTGPAFTMVFTPPPGSAGLTVIRTIATLAAGASATFTMIVNVNAATPGGTIITNTATATTATFDPNLLNNAAIATTTVAAQADLSITKTDMPDPVVAGTNLTYTLTVTNNGPSDAQTVQIMDTTPANTTFVSATPSAGGVCVTPAVGGTGLITCTWAGATAPGGVRTTTIVVNVNASTPNGTIITNTATTSSMTTDPNPGNNTATATTTVITQADLSITKTDAPDPVIAGTNITYTIIITNNGPSDAQNVNLMDTTPANTTFVSSTPSAGGACVTPAVGGVGLINCTWAGATPPGTTRTETLVVRVNSSTANGAVITNTATTTSATTDPTPANNTATATTAVIRRTDLSITKIDAPDPVLAGTILTYTVVVTNNGASDASGVVVTDMLPVGENFVSATPSQGACTFTIATRTVTCNLGVIVAGGGATIIVRVIPVVAGMLTNTACVMGNEVDPVPANNCATAVTTVQAPIFRPSLTDVRLEFGQGTDGSDGTSQNLKREGLLLADFARNQVVVLLGLINQDRFFFRRVFIAPVGTGPVAVAVGDFNSDGRVDAAIANLLSGDVSILMGNGDGTFDIRQRPISVGILPDALVVGDFNGDRILDLAVSNFADGNVLILRGRGDGTFQRGSTLEAGIGPTSMATGDFDRDGRLDLAVANFGSSDVTILRGRGDGTFTRLGSAFVSGLGPVSIIATDLDGDGQLELVTANFLSNDTTILRAGGRVGFMIDRTLPAAQGPIAVIADRLLTPRIALATANLLSGEVAVRLGGANGQLMDERRYAAVPNPISITVGDFNNDGRLDLAVLDFDGITVRALLDRGDGTFGPPRGSQEELSGSGQRVTGSRLRATGSGLQASDGAVVQKPYR